MMIHSCIVLFGHSWFIFRHSEHWVFILNDYLIITNKNYNVSSEGLDRHYHKYPSSSYQTRWDVAIMSVSTFKIALFYKYLMSHWLVIFRINIGLGPLILLISLNEIRGKMYHLLIIMDNLVALGCRLSSLKNLSTNCKKKISDLRHSDFLHQ